MITCTFVCMKVDSMQMHTIISTNKINTSQVESAKVVNSPQYANAYDNIYKQDKHITSRISKGGE